MVDYVNRGPDARPLGAFGAYLQAWLSFRSPNPPKTRTFHLGGTELLVAWPLFISLNIAWPNGWYSSRRAGWRYDYHWGNQTPCGNCVECEENQPWECESPTKNPPPHGGYIADVIVKLKMRHRVHF